jgi:hypothetical protein
VQAERERLEAMRREEAERAAERAEQERLEAERLAAERAESERQARERVARVAAPPAPDPTPPDPTRPDDGSVPTAPRPAVPGVASGSIPRFVEFRSGNAGTYVFGAFFTVFAAAAVIAIFWAVSEGTRNAVLAAGGLTALAMASWWALLSWSPPIVAVSNGLLEISRVTSTGWDLRDPATEITFRGRPSSRSWKAVVRSEGGKPVTISARQVDPALFVEIAKHYQAVGPRGDTEDA